MAKAVASYFGDEVAYLGKDKQNFKQPNILPAIIMAIIYFVSAMLAINTSGIVSRWLFGVVPTLVFGFFLIPFMDHANNFDLSVRTKAQLDHYRTTISKSNMRFLVVGAALLFSFAIALADTLVRFGFLEASGADLDGTTPLFITIYIGLLMLLAGFNAFGLLSENYSAKRGKAHDQLVRTLDRGN